jgi:hypothetical protein
MPIITKEMAQWDLFTTMEMSKSRRALRENAGGNAFSSSALGETIRVFLILNEQALRFAP